MNASSERPFDRVSETKPMDGFGLLVAASLTAGILQDFIAQLANAGFNRTTLDAQVAAFLHARQLDSLETDPRFWESMLQGVEEFHRRPPPGPVLQVQVKPTNRSILTRLEDTLPPYKEDRDRRVQFEDDGSILYPEHDRQWAEPPRDINGYQRDPDNPFRFLPLWKECTLRHGIAVRYPQCGCIEIIMRCNNPTATCFGNRITWEECRDCQVRKEPSP